MKNKVIQLLQDKFMIEERIIEFCNRIEETLSETFTEIDTIAQYNQAKVLWAMQKNQLSDIHFAATTGYGYNDLGRDTLEQIYADTFGTEAALVRPQMISGTHALATALFGNLKHGDELISIVGTPYDTLQTVIGIEGHETRGSLQEHGVLYKQVDLLQNGSPDYENIKKVVSPDTKMVTIQRSKGYEWRPSFSVEEIKKLIATVKEINPSIIVMVDNCYGEFVDYDEPSNVGADMTVGSLIKNPGGGLAPVGGYIVGTEECVANASFRLTAPGIGREAGPTLGITSSLIQGFFLAPQVVSASVKGAVFAAAIFEKLGYSILPAVRDKRSDIVQAIQLGSAEAVKTFCAGIQKAAPVDSYVTPEPWAMPGYACPVIMAAGAFVQGSSIELSADAPMKEPYNVFLQGGLTWHHAHLGLMIALQEMISKGQVALPLSSLI